MGWGNKYFKVGGLQRGRVAVDGDSEPSVAGGG